VLLCANTGGTLKIYGETISPEVPYKTLLLSMNDTAAQVVRETLDKYGLEKEDAHHYCLIEVTNKLVFSAAQGELVLEQSTFILETVTVTNSSFLMYFYLHFVALS